MAVRVRLGAKPSIDKTYPQKSGIELLTCYSILMRGDKKETLKLRSFGKSYSEISAELGVPKSTLSDWLSKFPWSNNIKRKLTKNNIRLSTSRIAELSKIRDENRKLLYAQAEQEARKDFDALKYHPLFIAAVMIYWGEGDKLSRSRVTVTNSDPAVLKIFFFFSGICAK